MGHHNYDKLVPEGIASITSKLPTKQKPKWSAKKSSMDNYLWYHAAQVGFLAGGDAWDKWNKPLRKLLVEKQNKEGDARGSWTNEYFRWGPGRSDTYGTALNIMILETYYRYFK